MKYLFNHLTLQLTRRIVIYDISGSIIFFHFTSITLRSPEKNLEHKICDLILSTTLSETIPTLTGIQRVVNVNVHRYSLKYPLFLLDFNET